LIVLEHVQNWLKVAREEGEFKARTVFLRKDGTPFTADVRITPYFPKWETNRVLWCDYPSPEVEPQQRCRKPSLATRIFAWMVVTRAPFLSATIIPILAGAAWVSARGLADPFPWGLLALAMLGGISLHISANTFNDYFDWRSGTDKVK
jgi:1,4-dihydroxy-2-naphthoate polyprenyltransferase